MRVAVITERCALAFILLISSALVAAPLQACAADGFPHVASKMTTAPMKANGSGVSVEYRVDAASAGQPASVVINFDQVTDPVGASVRLTVSGGLTLNGDVAPRVLAAGEKATLTVPVVAPADGVGYLNVFTTQSGATSVTSIPVGKSPSAMPSSGDLKQTPNGDAIISIPVK